MEQHSRFSTNSSTASPFLLNAQTNFSERGVQHNSYTCTSLGSRQSGQALSCSQFSNRLHRIRASHLLEPRETNNSKTALRSKRSNMCADTRLRCGCTVFILQLVSVPKAARLEGVCSHRVTKDLITVPDVTQG